MGEGLTVLPRKLDVTDPESIDRLAAQVEAELGQLNVLVNNAGTLLRYLAAGKQRRP